MSINGDFLFVDQQMQKLFQHQSANRTSSSSTKLSHPICTTSAISHLQSLCISLAMDKLFQAMCNIPNQHALLIQPKCTIPDQHALLIQPKCTIPDQHAFLIQPKCTILVHHAQLYHTFSTTPVQQHAQLQSKCTPDPHRIIQSNCTTQLRQQSNSKTEEEKDGHFRDPECFQECILIHGGYQVCWESVINACSKKKMNILLFYIF